MVTYRNISVILLYSLAFVFISCRGIQDIEFRGVENVQFHGIENNKVSFAADVVVSNPSSMNFKVSEVNLKTLVDGNYIGNLTSDENVKIKAKTDSAYTADFTLELANLISGATTLYSLTRKKQATIEMQGYVKARSWFTVKKVEVSEKQVIDIPSFNR